MGVQVPPPALQLTGKPHLVLLLKSVPLARLSAATIPDSLYPYAVKKTLYTSHWIKADYRVSKKVNLSLVAYVDFAKWKSDTDPEKTGDDVRTAYGYIPTIEYYPFDKVNLRFFANWVGRIYNYSDYSKTRFGVKDYTTGRFQIGFVTPLLIL